MWNCHHAGSVLQTGVHGSAPQGGSKPQPQHQGDLHTQGLIGMKKKPITSLPQLPQGSVGVSKPPGSPSHAGPSTVWRENRFCWKVGDAKHCSPQAALPALEHLQAC